MHRDKFSQRQEKSKGGLFCWNIVLFVGKDDDGLSLFEWKIFSLEKQDSDRVNRPDTRHIKFNDMKGKEARFCQVR
jgi:hypothetical protein